MEWFEAVILGLVQGLTEFLPVSSSGHLEIGKVLLGVETTNDLLFTTMVHAATVLSTIVVFRKQIWDLLKGFFKFSDNDQMDYVLKIAVSMIPVLIVGLFFKDSVEAMFGSIHVVGVALVMTALLLFFSDRASRPGMKSIFPEIIYSSLFWIVIESMRFVTLKTNELIATGIANFRRFFAMTFACSGFGATASSAFVILSPFTL